nr:hypothetical protein CFP56_18640 [Quercus suber]
MMVKQIIAAQSGFSNTPKAIPVSTSFPLITQASSKGSKFQTITSQKDELPPRKPKPEKAIPMLSKPSISSSKPEYKRRNNIANSKAISSSMKSTHQHQLHNQLGPFNVFNVQAKGIPQVKENSIQKRMHELQHSPSIASSSSYLATGLIEPGLGYSPTYLIDKKPDQADDISKDVASTIKQIDSHISALKLCSGILDSNMTSTSLGLMSKPIIAAQSGFSNTPKATPVSTSFPLITQASSKGSKFQTITSQKDKLPPRKPKPEKAIPMLSKPSISSSKPEYKRRNNIANSKAISSSMKSTHQHQLHNQIGPFNVFNVQAKGIPQVKENSIQKRMHELQHSPSIASSSSYLATGLIEPGLGYSPTYLIDKKPDQADDISKDVASTIKQIDSHISALKLCSGILDSNMTSTSLGLMSKPVTPLTQIKDGFGKNSKRRNLDGPVLLGLDRSELPSQQASELSMKHLSPVSKPIYSLSQPASQIGGGDSESFAKARGWPSVRSKIGLLSRATNRNDDFVSQRGDYVHGFRFPTSQPLKESEKLKDPMAQIETTRKEVKSRPSMPPQSVGSTDSLWPHQMVIKPTQLGLDQRKGTHKISHEGPHNKILPLQFHDESDGLSSSSDSYFSISDRQGSISGSESNSESYEKSLPSQTRAHNHIGPTSESSWANNQQGSGPSSIESSGYSLPIQTQAHHKRVVITSESSESYGYSLPRAQHHIGPTLRIASESSSEDTIGSYVGPTRRFKSSLGHKKKNSMWKPLKKMLRHDNRGIQKVKKSTVSSVPRKHQVKHFHGLMEGLLRHVRHSKKSKGSKGRIRRLGNGARVGNKRVAKKLQWWKMLRRQGLQLLELLGYKNLRISTLEKGL